MIILAILAGIAYGALEVVHTLATFTKVIDQG